MSAISFVISTSSIAITRIVHARARHLLAARDHLVVDRQALGPEDEVDEHVAVPRLDEPLLRRVARRACPPPRAPRARARRPPRLIIRSRSWRVSGPPRAHEARLPPSRNGTPASRSAAAAFFSVASRSANGCSSRRTCAASYPGTARGHGHPLRERTARRGAARECAIRIAADGRHPPRPAPSDEERWARGVRRAARPRRPRPARRRPDHARRARAGGDGRARRCARSADVPVLAVLGNHDWHANRRDEVVAALREGGDRRARARAPRARARAAPRSAIAGCKGFVGGFDGAHMPDFGEPLHARRSTPSRSREAEALDAGAARDRAVPVPDRAAALRADHRDAGGRAHRHLAVPRHGPPGRAAARAPPGPRPARARPRRARSPGALGDVPVYNVSVPVLGEDFWVFEMTGAAADAVRGALGADLQRAGRRRRWSRPQGRTPPRGRSRRATSSSWKWLRVASGSWGGEACRAAPGCAVV